MELSERDANVLVLYVCAWETIAAEKLHGVGASFAGRLLLLPLLDGGAAQFCSFLSFMQPKFIAENSQNLAV